MPAPAKTTLRSFTVQPLEEVLRRQWDGVHDTLDDFEAREVRKQIRFEAGVRRTAYLLWSLVIAAAGWMLFAELANL